MMLTIEDAIKYCDEIERNYFGDYRVFKHPNAASAVILFKNSKLVGMCRKSHVLNSNRFRYIMQGQYVTNLEI